VTHSVTEDDMQFRETLVALFAVAMLGSAAALAQPATIGQAYEAEKAAEISTAKLQLATQSGSAAIQELNDAESALRRLGQARTAEQHRSVAAELEMAITRLKLAAGTGSGQR